VVVTVALDSSCPETPNGRRIIGIRRPFVSRVGGR
jgi:hypothetical protein